MMPAPTMTTSASSLIVPTSKLRRLVRGHERKDERVQTTVGGEKAVIVGELWTAVVDGSPRGIGALSPSGHDDCLRSAGVPPLSGMAGLEVDVGMADGDFGRLETGAAARHDIRCSEVGNELLQAG